MLIFNLKTIGVNLREYRKRLGMTQAEVAEASNLSDRTYADIERGITNPRLETFLSICEVLHVLPNDILIDSSQIAASENAADIIKRLASCSSKEQKTALALLKIYLDSLA